MVRLEIIANRSVEEDLFDLFGKRGIAAHYTKIPEVHGVGDAGPRQGDHIWPEENVLLIIYCQDDEAKQITDAVAELKEFFTDEGIKVFRVPVAEA